MTEVKKLNLNQMPDSIENREIRGMNLRTLIIVISTTASVVVSIMMGVNKIENKIDEFASSQRQMQAIYDLKIQTMQTQIDQVHNDVILNRKIIETK